MPKVACPHCTFLNSSARKKCAMCLKFLVPRTSASLTSERVGDDSATKPSQTSADHNVSRKRGRSFGDEQNGSSSPSPTNGAGTLVNVDTTPAPDTAPKRHVVKLNTFFSTAAGKTVQVSEAALAAASRKFSDFEGTSVLSSQDTKDSEVGTDGDARSREAGAVPGLVATFFATAGGRPVTVKATNLEQARARLEQIDAEEEDDTRARATRAAVKATERSVTSRSGTVEPPQLVQAVSGQARVDTIFTTAAGSTVKVSSAALAKASARFKEQSDGLAASTPHADTEEDSSDDATTRSSSCTSSSGDSSPMKRPNASMRTAPPPAAPQSARGARRGFVPPQRITPVTRNVGATADPAQRVPTAAIPSRAAPRTSTRLTPIVFRSVVFASLPAPRIPREDEITSGFSFTLGLCGTKMRQAMKAPVGQAHDGECVEVEHFRELLLTLDASRTHCTSDWCSQVLRSAMFKALRLARCTPAIAEEAFSPGTVALCLSQKYNSEIVEGRRPVLRQMTEGDVPSMSLATVYVSEHCVDRTAPHTNVVRVSDGYYHLKATLDLPLSNLLREGALPVGQRIAICGSRCLLPNPCSPWECFDRVVLGLNYNGVRPVGATSPLGVAHAEPLPLPVALVHPMGGLVPVLKGVVSRVMPPFFVTTPTHSAANSAVGGGAGGAAKVVRNWHAQLQHVDQLVRNAQRTSAADGANAQRPADEDLRVARVTSCLIVDDRGNEALIQQWENCTEETSVAEPDQMSGPVEGSTIATYGLTPAKAFIAFAPFTSAKLFHASRQLRYTTIARATTAPLRVISSCLNDPTTPFTMGAAVDVVGLFMGSLETEQGMFVLLLQEHDCYVLLQIPVASARSTLSFAMPATPGVPLVVEHAVFVTRDDGDAGSDCARVFAKEYTRVVQRSVQPLLSKPLQEAGKLAVAFAQRRQKYQSRKEAIFASLQESISAPGRPRNTELRSQSPATSSAAASLTATTINITVPDGVDTVAAAGGAKPARVPYYLRASTASASTSVRNSGVVLPDPRAPLPRASAEPWCTTAQTTARPTIHQSDQLTPLPAASYGNVVSLRLAWMSSAAEAPTHPSVSLLDAEGDDALLSPPTAATDTANTSWQPVFSVTWRYDVGDTCVRTARVQSPAVLEALLEPCVGLQKACNVSSAQQEVECSLQRHALLRRWKKEYPAGALWWAVLSRSTVASGTPNTDEEAAEERMVWQPAEWATVKSMLRHALKDAFYRFNVDTSMCVLRSAHFIAETCNVADLI